MTLQVRNCVAVLPDEDGWEIRPGDLWVDGGRIVPEPSGAVADRVIDAAGAFVLPGLVNAHHHIYSRLARGLPVSRPTRNFPEVLEHLWWILDRALDRDSVALSTVLALRDCIANGVTTVFDHHSSPGFIPGSLAMMAELFDRFGVRGSVCAEISGRNGAEIFTSTLEETAGFAGTTGVKPMLGLHAGFTLSDAQLKLVANRCPDLPVHIHVAEDPVDVHFAHELGETVLGRLDRFGMLRGGSLLVHGNYLSRGDLELAAGKSLRLAQNIESAMNNTVIPADPALFAEFGLSSVAGTDGMTANMLRTHKTAFLLLRHRRNDPTAGFAEIMGQLRESWRLKADFGFDLGLNEGDEADFIITDTVPGVIPDSSSWPGHFLYGVTEGRVRSVIRGERILLDEYRLAADLLPQPGDHAGEVVKALHERFTELDREGE